jgi:hypothetical protein
MPTRPGNKHWMEDWIGFRVIRAKERNFQYTCRTWSRLRVHNRLHSFVLCSFAAWLMIAVTCDKMDSLWFVQCTVVQFSGLVSMFKQLNSHEQCARYLPRLGDKHFSNMTAIGMLACSSPRCLYQQWSHRCVKFCKLPKSSIICSLLL